MMTTGKIQGGDDNRFGEWTPSFRIIGAMKREEGVLRRRVRSRSELGGQSETPNSHLRARITNAGPSSKVRFPTTPAIDLVD